MADRPILFSGPMVLALLDGRKTQTRRLIDIEDAGRNLDFIKVATDTATGRSVYEMKDKNGQHVHIRKGKHTTTPQFMPPFAIGDRLWVRETLACCIDWGLFYDAHGGIGPSEEHFLRDERADAIVERYSRDDETLWNVPSIFMPRWASRLTLTVTDVRVERLCSISDEDAVAEGILPDPSRPGWWMSSTAETDRCPTPLDAYLDLWNFINGDGAARLDPWVIAYSFTVERRNIDAPANVSSGELV
jgi:hypothetical protein